MSQEKQERRKARGVYAALLTPRRPNSIEADGGALLDYLDAVAGAGVDGFVLFGSTGEFPHFDVEERVRAAGLAIKRSRVPVLVNVSHSSLAGAMSLAGSALDAGAAGVLLMPPFFYQYSEDQIFAFYSQFLEFAGRELPIYLYNLPQFVNPITPKLAMRLFETGGFAGIKDSSGDWQNFIALRALREHFPFQLLMGHESIYAQGRSAGADGIVSGLAAAVPELIVALNRAVNSGDSGRAARLNEKLVEFLQYVAKFPSTVAIRQAAVARGWKVRHSAVPLDEDTAAEVIAFQAWFRTWFAGVLQDCQNAAAMRT